MTKFRSFAVLAVLLLVIIASMAMGELFASRQHQKESMVWEPLGPRQIPNAVGDNPTTKSLAAAGKLQAVAVDLSNPQTIYAGGGTGPGNSGPYSEAGIYKTTDGGNTWSPIDVGLTDRMVSALWLDQADTHIVLAGTWFEGIFRSIDAGATWNLVFPYSTCAFVQAGGTLYAATAAGIAGSDDAGANWMIIQSTPSQVRALAAAGDALYAGLEDGTVLGRLTQEHPWRTLRTQPGATVWSIAADSFNPNIAYVVEWEAGRPGNLYVTYDAGANWAPLQDQQFNTVQFVAVNATNPNIVYVGGNDFLARSMDKGNTFVQLPLSLEVRLIYPMSNSLIVGSDQGLFMSKDLGITWMSLNGNISSSLLTGIAVNGNTVFTTAHDFSPIITFDGGSTWQHRWGPNAPVGEGGTVMINPSNPDYVYVFTATAVGGGLQYSTDGGRSFHFSQDRPVYTASATSNTIAVDPIHPARIYTAAASGVLMSEDGGVTWSACIFACSSSPTLVAVDPADSMTIFVGQQQLSALFISRDGGATWDKSDLSGARGWPTTIVVHPENSSIVLLGLSLDHKSGGGILRSTDGGATFTFANTGLTPKPFMTLQAVWDLEFDPISHIVAAATAGGPYISRDLGITWQSIQFNAVPYVFTGLAWSGGYLYVATYGEGVLRMSFAGNSNAGTVSGIVYGYTCFNELTPLFGAVVAAINATGFTTATTTSQADGSFNLTLQPGTYKLSVAAPFYRGVTGFTFGVTPRSVLSGFNFYLNSTSSPLCQQVNFQGDRHTIAIYSNSSTANISFDPDSRLLKFTISGTIGTVGAVMVVIPKTLLDGTPIVLVDNVEVPSTFYENSTYYFVQFTSPLSLRTVTVGGSNTIPEFASNLILVGAVTVSLVKLLMRMKKKSPDQSIETPYNKLKRVAADSRRKEDN